MPSAWTTVLANIAGVGRPASTARRTLLAGTGSDQVHLLVVCTAERGLCGAFNSVDRAARARARQRAAGRGQDGQDPLRRPQGLRPAAPQLRASRSSSASSCAASSTLGFAQRRRRSPRRSSRCSTNGEFDVCTLFFSRFKSVIAQIPTAQQIIPPVFEAKAADAARRRGLRIRAGRGRDPRRAAAAQHLGADLPRAAGERRVRATARR